MRRDPRVALPVTDMASPVPDGRDPGTRSGSTPGENCRYMDPISFRYTNAPFPSRGPDRVRFVIAVEKAGQQTLSFTHHPR